MGFVILKLQLVLAVVVERSQWQAHASVVVVMEGRVVGFVVVLVPHFCSDCQCICHRICYTICLCVRRETYVYFWRTASSSVYVYIYIYT